MIIHNYLRREVYGTTFAVTGVLLAIFLSNQLVHFLSRAAAGKMPSALIFKLLLIQVPNLASLLLPLGFFFGILLTFGRLYVDNEMSVLSACGFSPRQLFTTFLSQALWLALLVACLTLWVCPKLMAYRDQLVHEFQAAQGMQVFMPGRFQASKDGRHVVYVGKITRDQSKMADVFVAERVKPKAGAIGPDKSVDPHFAPQYIWHVLKAMRAHRVTDPNTGDEFLVAEKGYRYFGIPGNRDYRTVAFDENGIRINHQHKALNYHHEAISSFMLLGEYFSNPHVAAEMQWRLSMPLSVIILGWIALAICRVNGRRQGKFNKLLPGILFYVTYANVLFVARSWVGKEKVSIALGMWWWHGVMLLLAILLWYSLVQNSWQLKWRRG